MANKDLKIVYTYLSRSAMPENLLNHAEWRKFGRDGFTRPVSWQTAMRKYAEFNGGALLWRADDSMVSLTKLQNGKIRKKTYKPGTWGWSP